MERNGASYLIKARESLAGAEREFVAGAYNNSANRAYYACFQAAIAALVAAGFGPNPGDQRWRHQAVQSLFNDHLVARRKLFPAELRSTLGDGVRLRNTADYGDSPVTAVQATRLLRRARAFVAAIGTIER